MGGLARRLPITFWTFLAGTLAIAGVFPLAGFFSKDEILWKAFSGGSAWLWGLGFLAAGLTAFYMMRLVVLTFAGENRATEEVRHHIHESPATMTAPLVVLAILSVCGGWMGWPHFLGGSNHFERWLEPVFESHPAAHATLVHGAEAAETGGEHAGSAHLPVAGMHPESVSAHGADDPAGATEHGVGAAAGGSAHVAGEAAHADVQLEWTLMFASLGIALLGLGLGYWIYARRLDLAGRLRGMAGGRIHTVLWNKYWVDELYDATVIRPGYRLSRGFLWGWIDKGLIDGLLVNGSALMVSLTGGFLRLVQNGRLRSYAYVFTVGVAVFVLYLSIWS
jgi:NADH-quinone oxidoreductase subunit L